MPDLTERLSLERYRACNDSFADPLIFRLTRRGFFSEVIGLLNAIAYGLLSQRRIHVDQSTFGGLAWRDFFSTTIPPAAPIANVDPDWVIDGVHFPHFSTIRREIAGLWKRGQRVDIDALGFRQVDIFTLRRELANLFCVPLDRRSEAASSHWRRFDSVALDLVRRLALTPEGYAAMHVRRGDKILGYRSRSGALTIEGEDVPLGHYLDVIRDRAPGIDSVFVLTDDYGVIEELGAMEHGCRVVTLCPPDERGHDAARFNGYPVGRKRRTIERLLAEAQIASQSALFVGGYKSNVARFIVNVHRDGARCVSIDSSKDWTPD